eukprot:IDg5973t1
MLPGTRARTRRDIYNRALFDCVPVPFRADASTYRRVLGQAIPDFAVIVSSGSGRADEPVAEELRQVLWKQLESLSAALTDAVSRLIYRVRVPAVQDETRDWKYAPIDHHALKAILADIEAWAGAFLTNTW